MIAVIVIAHEPLATALVACTRHVFGSLPTQVAALDVVPDEDPVLAARAARELIARISDGSGVIVLTDIFGATPSRIARSLFDPHKIAVVSGASLPIIVKALSLRRKPMPVTDLVDALIAAGHESILELIPEPEGLKKSS